MRNRNVKVVPETGLATKTEVVISRKLSPDLRKLVRTLSSDSFAVRNGVVQNGALAQFVGMRCFTPDSVREAVAVLKTWKR